MSFRTFTRTWWADAACTVPKPGRRNYKVSRTFDTAEEAARYCQQYNRDRFGETRRGPRGLCMEFEEA